MHCRIAIIFAITVAGAAAPAAHASAQPSTTFP
jgi:hypothetical protein